MTENRWDEIWNKPAFNFLSYHPEELLRVPGKISVNYDWLKEVKTEGDRLSKRDAAVKEILVRITMRDMNKMAMSEGLTRIFLLYEPKEAEVRLYPTTESHAEPGVRRKVPMKEAKS